MVNLLPFLDDSRYNVYSGTLLCFFLTNNNKYFSIENFERSDDGILMWFVVFEFTLQKLRVNEYSQNLQWVTAVTLEDNALKVRPVAETM